MLGSLVFMHGLLCCEGHEAYSICARQEEGGDTGGTHYLPWHFICSVRFAFSSFFFFSNTVCGAILNGLTYQCGRNFPF